GQSPTGTAYATANLLPNVLFEVVAGGALAGAVVPLLAGPLARGMRHDVDRIASALLTWAVAALLPASVLLAVLARPVNAALIRPDPSVTDPAVTAATLDLAGQLLVIFAPQVVLYGIGVVLTGVLQAQRRFVWPAAAPLASTVVVVTSYMVFRSLADGAVDDPGALPTSAVLWLGWGTTAGVAAMTLPLLVPVLRSGVRLRPTFAFPEGVARRARHLALAGLGGLVAQQASVVVVASLASSNGGASGTINLFQYSQAVYFLPYAVLAVPLATVVFPRLAEHVASGDAVRYSRLVSISTRAVLVVSTAGAAALVAAAPAVAAVFARIDASNDTVAISAMSPTLTLLAPGLLGFALIFHAARVLYAMEQGRAAVTAVAGGWLAVLVASVVAVQLMAPRGGDPVTRFLGLALGQGDAEAATLGGLALGNTVGMVVAGVLLLAAITRAAGRTCVVGVGRSLGVAAGAGLVGAVAGRVMVDVVLGSGSGLPQAAGWLAAVAAAGVGTGGVVIGAGAVIGATWLMDRGTILGVLRREPQSDREDVTGTTDPEESDHG
ncbi:murein biosynthesis integral membrane protein MurJ, partial [Actinotalea sp. K2]|uniref:murein biosynthesis integral membrane protein MurJ n=1 Tax=Actinotalea sp. K2 TaxID=2939438 RepID=UPI00201771C8